MSKGILAMLIPVLAASPLWSAEVILPYSAFGPQAAAYELIGMAWWQWESHGGEDDHDDPIKVVVYWDQTEEETARLFPVDQAKQHDFRYVEYGKAVEHLENTIKSFREEKLDASIMERSLAELRKRKAEVGMSESDARSESDSEGGGKAEPDAEDRSR